MVGTILRTCSYLSFWDGVITCVLPFFVALLVSFVALVGVLVMEPAEA